MLCVHKNVSETCDIVFVHVALGIVSVEPSAPPPASMLVQREEREDGELGFFRKVRPVMYCNESCGYGVKNYVRMGGDQMF